MKRKIWLLAAMMVGSLVMFAARQRETSKEVEWLYYGGDPGNSKYSPLTDVNGGNIQRLQIAWQWAAGAFEWKWFSPHVFGYFCLGMMVTLTLVSGLSYFWKNRALFRDGK